MVMPGSRQRDLITELSRLSVETSAKVKYVLAVPARFTYNMRWQTNLQDALSARR